MYQIALWLVFSPDVAALASDEYAVREAAEARLSRFADLTWPLLDRSFTDCEQRRRARRVVAQAIPQSYPPLALLSGSPLAEWQMPATNCHSVGLCPGLGWHMAWVRPDPAAPLGFLIHYYGERTRTQYTWRDWQSAADGREATRLLVRDLLNVGVPAPVVRELVGWMQRNEDRLYSSTRSVATR
jgi:hypothetical protein